MDLPGSFLAPHEVLAGGGSPELRSAIRLIQHETSRHGVELTCVARPEFFTHGLPEQWLRTQVPNVSQHLCLTDGHGLKYLPGLETHLFFYDRSFVANVEAWQTLSRRAPELMSRVASQVNSALVLGYGMGRVHPMPVIVANTVPVAQAPSILLPFLLNPHSAADSANHILARGPIIAETLTDLREILYIPLTEMAMRSRGFARAVASAVLSACFDPQSLVVLRLPLCRAGPNRLSEQIAAILPALRDCGILLPRVLLRNVLFATQDLEEDSPLLVRAPFRLSVHDSFDFWRHSASFYARAAQVTVIDGAEASPGARFLPNDVSDIYGPNAVRRSVDTGLYN